MKTPRIGRNDPCPCGSGKKFKHHCLGKESRTAHVTRKVHRVLIDVLRDPSRWHDLFISKVKKDNIKRPAFQEEFAKAVPSWQTLN